MMPESKIALVIIVVVFVVAAGIVSVRFISQKMNVPSAPGQQENLYDKTSDGGLPKRENKSPSPTFSTGTAQTPIPLSSPSNSSQSKEDAAAQIRALNNVSNEYNNYNNAANQMNSANTSL